MEMKSFPSSMHVFVTGHCQARAADKAVVSISTRVESCVGHTEAIGDRHNHKKGTIFMPVPRL